MKFLSSVSVLILSVLVGACGSSNPNAVSNYGYGTGYGYNSPYGYYGQTGLNNSYMGGQIPLYQNGQIVGYKTQTPVLGSFFSNIVGNNFQQSVQVNAGDRLRINLGAASYGVSVAYCDGSVADSVRTGNRVFPLNNLSVSLNGQNIGNAGSFTVSAAGTLAVQAYLNPVQVSCGWLFGNRPAQVYAYFVNLAGGILVERCTNVQGAPISCPY